MGIINFQTFLIASLVFVISPGIDTIFVLNTSITQSRKAGFFATLGITTGLLIHTLLAALGLSLLLAKSAVAFSIVKYLGAIYLIYLGVTKVLSKQSLVQDSETPIVVSTKKAYTSAVITNAFNPKVAIFFLAFFPQFIDPGYLNSSLPFLILGLTNALLTILWFSVLTYFAGSLSATLRTNEKFNVWLKNLSGLAFIAMGFKIAISKK